MTMMSKLFSSRRQLLAALVLAAALVCNSLFLQAHAQRNLLASAYGSGEAMGAGESNQGSAQLSLSSGASSGAADTGDTMSATSTGGGNALVDANEFEDTSASGAADADAIFADLGSAVIESTANAAGEGFSGASAAADVFVGEAEDEDTGTVFGTSFAQGIADAIADGDSSVDTQVMGGTSIELGVERPTTIGWTESEADANTEGFAIGLDGSESGSELIIGSDAMLQILDDIYESGVIVDSKSNVEGGSLSFVEGPGEASTDIEASGMTYSYTGHAGAGIGGNLDGQGEAMGEGESYFVGSGLSYGAEDTISASLSGTELEAISGSATTTGFGVTVINPYAPVILFDGEVEAEAYGGGIAYGTANGNAEAGFDSVVFGKSFAESDMLQELYGLSLAEEEASSLIEADASTYGSGYSSGGSEGVSASAANGYSTPLLLGAGTAAQGSGNSKGEGYSSAGADITNGYATADAGTVGSGSSIAGTIYIGEGGSGGAAEAYGANDYEAIAHGAGYGSAGADANGAAGSSVTAFVDRFSTMYGVADVNNMLYASSGAEGDYTETSAAGNDFGATGSIIAAENSDYGEGSLGVTTTDGYTETSVDSEALGHFYGLSGSNVYVNSDTLSEAEGPTVAQGPINSDTVSSTEAGAGGYGLKVYTEGDIATGTMSETIGGGGAGFEKNLGYPYRPFETAAIGAGVGDAMGTGFAAVSAGANKLYPGEELGSFVSIGAASEAGSGLGTETQIGVAADNTGSLANTVTETGVAANGAGATYAVTKGDSTGAATAVDGTGKLAFEQGSGSMGEDYIAYGLNLALADLNGASEGSAKANTYGEDSSLEAEASGSAAGVLVTDSLVDAFNDQSGFEDVIAASAMGAGNFVATGYADTVGESTYVETAAESEGYLEGETAGNIVSKLPSEITGFGAISSASGFETGADIAVSNFGEGANSGAISVADAAVGGENFNLIGPLVGFTEGSNGVFAVTGGVSDVVADYGEVDGEATSGSDSWIIDAGQAYKDFSITCMGEDECNRVNGGFVSTRGVGIGAAESDADAYETSGGAEVAQSQSYGYGLGATIGAAIAIDGDDLSGGLSGGLGQGAGVALAEALEDNQILAVSITDSMGGASVFGINVGNGQAGSVAEGYADAYAHSEAGDDYVEANTEAEGFGFGTTFVSANQFGAERFASGDGESSGYADVDYYDNINADTYSDAEATLTPIFNPDP